MSILCPICECNDIQKVYYGKVRSGKYGVVTNEDFSVYLCKECSVRFLNPIPTSEDFYETDEYRQNYNATIDKKLYWEMAAREGELRLSCISIKSFVDKSVVDVGVGPGLFLDLVSGIANETIAIEPAKFFHKELQKKHQVFSYAEEMIQANKKGDIVLSFNVIEHVRDPLKFLKELKTIMQEGASLYLMTPNHDDILMEMIPKTFSEFYYRTAHLYYFDQQSIDYLLQKAGFKEYDIGYMHTMDMSNMMLWLKDHKPTGLKQSLLFDDNFNDIYKHYLEKKGKANYLWIEAKK